MYSWNLQAHLINGIGIFLILYDLVFFSPTAVLHARTEYRDESNQPKHFNIIAKNQVIKALCGIEADT